MLQWGRSILLVAQFCQTTSRLFLMKLRIKMELVCNTVRPPSWWHANHYLLTEMFEQSRDLDINGGNFYSAGRDVNMRISAYLVLLHRIGCEDSIARQAAQTQSILSVEEKLLRLERDISHGNAMLHVCSSFATILPDSLGSLRNQIHFLWLQSTVLFWFPATAQAPGRHNHEASLIRDLPCTPCPPWRLFISDFEAYQLWSL
jgi:hypothetical protein